MWPRLALWVAGFLVVPAAKYVMESVFEQPSYIKEIGEANARKAAQEAKDKEEFARFKAERDGVIGI
jgi:hypothetical protein